MQRIIRIGALIAALSYAPFVVASPLTGHFSATGTLLANDVGTQSGGCDPSQTTCGDGSGTLSFSEIEAGGAATFAGSFRDILAGHEASPTSFTIPYTQGATTNYTDLYIEFDNLTKPNNNLYVQILNLTAPLDGVMDGNGGYSYTYSGQTIYTVGSYTGDVFNANPDYSPTSGNISFTSQDEHLGSVTFSGTGSVYAAPAVPEPSSLVLLGTGALSVVGALRKRSKA